MLSGVFLIFLSTFCYRSSCASLEATSCSTQIKNTLAVIKTSYDNALQEFHSLKSTVKSLAIPNSISSALEDYEKLAPYATKAQQLYASLLSLQHNYKIDIQKLINDANNSQCKAELGVIESAISDFYSTAIAWYKWFEGIVSRR